MFVKDAELKIFNSPNKLRYTMICNKNLETKVTNQYNKYNKENQSKIITYIKEKKESKK
jgi:hypothetical protein